MAKTVFVDGTIAEPEFFNKINNPTYSLDPQEDGEIPYPAHVDTADHAAFADSSAVAGQATNANFAAVAGRAGTSDTSQFCCIHREYASGGPSMYPTTYASMEISHYHYGASMRVFRTFNPWRMCHLSWILLEVAWGSAWNYELKFRVDILCYDAAGSLTCTVPIDVWSYPPPVNIQPAWTSLKRFVTLPAGISLQVSEYIMVNVVLVSGEPGQFIDGPIDISVTSIFL